MMPSVSSSVAVAALLLLQMVASQGFELGTRDEILDSTRTLAFDGMKFYKGNESGETPGLLPLRIGPGKADYFWFQSGVMMSTYINYWYQTGDDTYNQLVTEGMLHQSGSSNDFFPRNYSVSIANEDQGLWALAAMLAAESKLPDPEGDQPMWIDLANNVFNVQVSRWDKETCDGGLRWMILDVVGFGYKSAAPNAVLFDLAARLARYTDDAEYATWANDIFDWLLDVNYIDNGTFSVYDGASADSRCEEINKLEFSFNSAVLINGAAFMYNYTGGDDLWKDRLNNLTSHALDTFFPDNVAVEIACEPLRVCASSSVMFKGQVHQWLAAATEVAPFLADRIRPVLRDSARAAAKQCTGGESGRACGYYWSDGEFVDPEEDNGTSGAGEAFDVLSAVAGLLVDGAPGPVTAKSVGKNDGVGSDDSDDEKVDESGAVQGGGAKVALAVALVLAFTV